MNYQKEMMVQVVPDFELHAFFRFRLVAEVRTNKNKSFMSMSPPPEDSKWYDLTDGHNVHHRREDSQLGTVRVLQHEVHRSGYQSQNHQAAPASKNIPQNYKWIAQGTTRVSKGSAVL